MYFYKQDLWFVLLNKWRKESWLLGIQFHSMSPMKFWVGLLLLPGLSVSTRKSSWTFAEKGTICYWFLCNFFPVPYLMTFCFYFSVLVCFCCIVWWAWTLISCCWIWRNTLPISYTMHLCTSALLFRNSTETNMVRKRFVHITFFYCYWS